MIKNLKFMFLFFVMSFAFLFADFCFADITGNKDEFEVYTYTVNSQDDVVLTSTMTSTENYAIQLDTQTATGLIINNENENENLWYNDDDLFINGNVSINNIYLLNESLFNATNLIISTDSHLETVADNLDVNQITNNGAVYLIGGNNTNEITGSSGVTVFANESSEIPSISTNSANIEQNEVVSQGYFLNMAAISANSYENYGLAYTSGTITVSSFSNYGTFINKIEDDKGALITDKIANEGEIYLYSDGGISSYEITGSSGVAVFINLSTETVSTNSANIQQYTVATYGNFSNMGNITSVIYENGGITDNNGIITVSSFTNYGSFYTNLENFHADDDITNEGYFEISEGTNTYKIVGSSGIIAFGSDEESITLNNAEIKQSTMYVQGVFSNQAEIEVDKNIINLEDGNLTNKSTMISANAFFNYGNLTNEATIEAANYFINYGTTTNTGRIKTIEIDNDENGLLKTDINDIEISSAIINYGKMELSGDGENNTYITGVGTTTITGNIENNNIFIQSYIINTGTITTSFANIYTEDKLINNGKLIITGESSYNYNNIEGTGSLIISTNAINISTITQNSITINSDVFFQSSSDDLNISEGITNNGILYLTDGINQNNITGSNGATVFVNVSTETPSISTNSANIEQNEVVSQGYFFNMATISANSYENYGLAYTSGTITVSSFSNYGTFINKIEDDKGTLITDKITNEGEIYLYSDGGISSYEITGSSGVAVFINLSTETVSTNSANIQQYTVATYGNFSNMATITSMNYENNGFTTNNGIITVSSFTNYGSFYTNLENFHADDDITNEGYFEISGGTNTYKIVGSSGIIAFGSDEESITLNNAEIKQSTMYVQGVFSNQAEIEVDKNIINLEDGNLTNKSTMISANAFFNYGNLTNESTIEASNYFINYGTTTNTGRIKTVEIDNGEGGLLQTNINDIEVSSAIINYGKMELSGDGENNVYITGMGTTTITGNIVNNNVFAQNYILNTGTITTSFANIYTEDKLVNNGKIIAAGNSSYNYNNIEGTGSLIISTNAINISTITQNSITINSDVFFQSSSDDLNISEGITNNGILYLTDGINKNNITGSSGTTVFVNVSTKTPSISTNSANIEQEAVISQGYFFNMATISADVYENDGLTYSSGAITVSSFTNYGTFVNGIEDNAGQIVSDVIINQYNLITNIDNIQTNNDITNEGYFEITGGTNTYKIVGSSGIIAFGSDENTTTNNAEIKQSTMYVQGVFINQAEIEVDNNIINLEDGNLINKSTMISANAFFNYGNLTNESTIEASNYFVNYGTATNTGIIKTVEIDNGEGGLLQTNINDIEVSSAIINYGKMELSGDGENNVYITGMGTTTITGNIVNNNVLAQNYIINQGTITTKLEQIYVSDAILNDGKITISTDSQYHYNTMNFEGNGTLEISTSILNIAKIKQNEVIISSTVDLYTNSDLLDIANLNNDGILVFSEDSKVNKSTITGSGVLYVLNDVVSSGGIEQDAVVLYQNIFTVDGSRFKANTLVNNGTLVLSNENINFENTYLQGNGTIERNVVIGSSATLAPGNSIGRFYVKGNLTFDNNSAYEVEIDDDDCDYTKAYGNITVNPGSAIKLTNLSGKFFEHKIYRILYTTNAISGGFDNISLSGYDIDVTTSTDLKESRVTCSTQTLEGQIQVTLSRKQTEYSTSSEITGLSVSQQAVAQAVDLISAQSNSGQIAKLLSELESYYYYNSTYNIEKLKDMFTSLSGTIYANNAMAPFLNARYEHIYDKIYKTDEVKDYVDEYYVEGEEYYETKRNLWTQYYYNYYDVEGDNVAPGYTDTIDGFYAGFDVSSSKHKLLGIVAGYAHGKLKQEYDQTETQSVNLGAYGAYNKDKFQLKSLLMLGYDMYDTDRQTKAKAQYNGYNVAFDLQASYDVKMNDIFVLQPFAGVLTDFIIQDSFSEKNIEALNLSAEQNSNLLAQARLGVDVTGKINLLNLYARFAIKQFLTQDYLETKVKIVDTGTEFTLRSAELASTSFDFGFGGDYALSEYWTAFANFQAGIGAGKSNNYYGNLGIKYKFGAINNENDYIIR